VTDGVFSMDGDVAKLPEIVQLAEKHNAIVMVDDAHGSGVMGSHGRGTVDHFGLHGQVDIVVGTMSKAFGAMGGYVASTATMREIMVNKARPLLFSTPHPPSVVASCIAAVELLESDDTLIKQLWYNTRYFKAGMKSIGLPIESETPLCPVIVGTSEKAQKLSQRLYEEGIYGRAIVFPTVAQDKARVRIIINANHTQPQLDRCIEAFEKIGRELGLR
jgi:glycine C-acetyltransferase